MYLYRKSNEKCSEIRSPYKSFNFCDSSELRFVKTSAKPHDLIGLFTATSWLVVKLENAYNEFYQKIGNFHKNKDEKGAVRRLYTNWTTHRNEYVRLCRFLFKQYTIHWVCRRKMDATETVQYAILTEREQRAEIVNFTNGQLSRKESASHTWHRRASRAMSMNI